MTFFAPASMCFAAFSRSVKSPLDSSTSSTPSAFHGSFAGARSARTRTVRPPMARRSSSARTCSRSGPCTESYCSRCASVFAFVMSLTATNSSASSPRQARRTFLPIRPNPLIPTRIFAMQPPPPARDPSHFAPRRSSKGALWRRARRQSERFIDIFWDAKNLATIQTASMDLKESPVAQVFRSGYQELQRLTKGKRGNPGGDEDTIELGGIENVQRAMHRARTQEVTRLERGLTFLATTASTAPFIGLFGTVWGIMTAFRGLSTTTSSSIQAVAPGIAEALIATAVGLAAAIPAVVMYNRFSRQLRVLTAEMDTFGSEFLNIAERHFLK